MPKSTYVTLPKEMFNLVINAHINTTKFEIIHPLF
jgi:hypothetical protein